jgi:hypothetical protein
MWVESETDFFVLRGGGGDASRFKVDYFHTNLLEKKENDKDAYIIC